VAQDVPQTRSKAVAVSKRYQVTFPPEIAAELEQYAYAKKGASVPRLLYDAALNEIARTALTSGQWARLVERYGKDAKASL
jgi:hypothetical protein